MKLLLDIGNTKTTLYIKDSSGKFEKKLVETEKTGKIISYLDNEIQGYDIKKCFISSVVPEVNETIINYLENKKIQTKILVPEDYKKLINVGDLNYTSMGADRVVVDYATIKKYGENIIVFDLGTAITVDVIKSGQYKTGYIFPGLRLIRDSLTAGTSQLKDFEFFELSADKTAVTTLTQLNDGIMYGLLGVINQYIKLGKTHFEDEAPKIILTGGSMYNILNIITMNQLVEILEANVFVDLSLMLDGLDKISEIL